MSEGELFEYKGASIGEDEISLAFNAIDEAKAGQPVLYLNGDTTAFDKEIEKEFERLTLTGTEFAAEPDSVGGIHGTYAYAWVDPDINVVVAGGNFAQEGNHFEEASGEEYTDCTRDISANTGYIVPSENWIENFNRLRFYCFFIDRHCIVIYFICRVIKETTYLRWKFFCRSNSINHHNSRCFTLSRM